MYKIQKICLPILRTQFGVYEPLAVTNWSNLLRQRYKKISLIHIFHHYKECELVNLALKPKIECIRA